jgi:hypothetical protein
MELSNKKIISFEIVSLGSLKKISSLLLVIFSITTAVAQYPAFSLSTDLSLQRNFKKDQEYWAVGHTTMANFHLSAKDGIYVWFCYFSDGKIKDPLTASAKLPVTLPQQINYENSARLRFKHFSLGWKKYLKGDPSAEAGWNCYGYAGLGLMLGRVINTHSVTIDTALYNVPVYQGKANFKRLTLDLGLGVEFPVGADFFIYGEAKALVPTTDYPSRYLFINQKAPFTGIVSAGVRLLF